MSGELDAAAAVLLGLIEGVTEWLPISSTGHLTVTASLLGLRGDAGNSYAIAIQAGAILAVLGLYRRRFAAMLRGVLGRDDAGRQTLVAVALSSLPAMMVGLALGDEIKARLFGPAPVLAAWLIGGVVILVVVHRGLDDPARGRPLTAMRYRDALLIGSAQVAALWPGTSRSLVTILAGLALGLSLDAAVEYSFLLGFFILGGATSYEVVTSGDEMIAAFGVAMPLLGLAVAFVSAGLAMRWMVRYLSRHGLAIFGWYRIAAAAILVVLLVAGLV